MSMHITKKLLMHVMVIIVFMNVAKNICHLMYKLAGTALDYLKEISITFIGEFTNYKFEFEGLQNRVADFE